MVDALGQRGAAMSASWARRVLTALAVVLAIGHLLFPAASIDAVTVALLVIAALPWLGAVFRAIEFPGGGRVEYQEFERVRKSAQEAGLLAQQAQPQVLTLMDAAQDTGDLTLPLAALRVELERRLRWLARASGIDDARQGMWQLTNDLQSRGVLSQAESSALADLRDVLNRAVHAQDLDPRSAKWAFDLGGPLLAALDRRIEDAKRQG